MRHISRRTVWTKPARFSLGAVVLVLLACNPGGREARDLRADCRDGSADACADLGERVFAGRQVLRDRDRAADLFEQACDGGAAEGCVRLGRMHEEGTSVVIAAGTKFKELAENELGERSLASMAAADGALYIRTAEHLYRIGE